MAASGLAQKPDCIFCQIVAGSAPAFPVDEDATTLSFLDLFPVAQGHTLVVTKSHFENLFETTPEALAGVAAASIRLAHAIRASIAPDGLGVFQLNGAAAGQTVCHYHMHLIPRWQGQSFQLHSRVRGNPDELRATAARIKAAVARQAG
jgi:histidine triad (HIT) family protein